MKFILTLTITLVLNVSLKGEDEICKTFSKTPLTIDEHKSMKLWHAHGQDPSKGETLYGFSEAFRKVWAHQHPISCSDVKYLIMSGNSGSGFASAFHVFGAYLAIAMNMGRVLLPNPIYIDAENPAYQFHFNYEHCKKNNYRNYDCYYEPISSCTYNDAIPAYNYSDPTSWPNKDIPIFDYTEGGSIDDAIKRHGEEVMNSRILRLKIGLVRSFEFPTQFNKIVECGGYPAMFDRKFWWEAVSAALFARPSKHTYHAMSNHNEFNIQADGQPCIALYIRHGDKHAEMKLVPWEDYVIAAQDMWNKGLVHKRHPTTDLSTLLTKNGTMFVGTDDPVALIQMKEWGKVNGWKILHTNLFDRSKMSWADAQRGPDQYPGGRHPLEYLSMIMNVDYTLQCDAWVGTQRSNTCQLHDQLRDTVLAKADLYAADLNVNPVKVYAGLWFKSYETGMMSCKGPDCKIDYTNSKDSSSGSVPKKISKQ